MTTNAPAQLGMIGMGRMGLPMAKRLGRVGGFNVKGYDRLPSVSDTDSLASLVTQVGTPGQRVMMSMLSEKITGHTMRQLSTLLRPGDIVINGANDYPRHDVEYEQLFGPLDIHYIDLGVSGGVLGGNEDDDEDAGYALSAGGPEEIVERLMPFFTALKPIGPHGFSHAATPVGSGHAAKLVHNLIEYGQMASLAEGYALAKALKLNVNAVLDGWRSGTIIKSRLLDLLSEGLKKDPLDRFSPHVPNGGSGLEALMLAFQLGVPTPVCSAAFQGRLTSCDEVFDAQRAQNELRWFFGEHEDALAVND